jgi:hypothetical protein
MLQEMISSSDSSKGALNQSICKLCIWFRHLPSTTAKITLRKGSSLLHYYNFRFHLLAWKNLFYFGLTHVLALGYG